MASNAEMRRPCRSRSEYGRCGRSGQHEPPHAVAIGDGVWFGYLRGGEPLGYGHFHGDTFNPGPHRVCLADDEPEENSRG